MNCWRTVVFTPSSSCAVTSMLYGPGGNGAPSWDRPFQLMRFAPAVADRPVETVDTVFPERVLMVTLTVAERLRLNSKLRLPVARDSALPADRRPLITSG